MRKGETKCKKVREKERMKARIKEGRMEGRDGGVSLWQVDLGTMGVNLVCISTFSKLMWMWKGGTETRENGVMDKRKAWRVDEGKLEDVEISMKVGRKDRRSDR